METLRLVTDHCRRVWERYCAFLRTSVYTYAAAWQDESRGLFFLVYI